jgi:hypothetical protein
MAEKGNKPNPGPVPIPKIGGGKTLPMPVTPGGARPVPMPKPKEKVTPKGPRDRGRPLNFQMGAADRASSRPYPPYGLKPNPLQKVVGGILEGANKVGNYVGNIAREARDIPTALGTNAVSALDREMSRPGKNQTQVDNSTKAGWNMRAQVKDVFQAIGGETRQSRSDQYNDQMDYKKGSTMHDSPKKPRPIP